MSRARFLLLPSLLAINAAVWAVALTLFPAPLPPIRIFAEYCSTSAIVLMSANLVLSTRPRVLDRWFGGLDKLFVAHRYNGIAVALLLISHFTVIPKLPGLLPLPIADAALLLLFIGAAILPRTPLRVLDVVPYHVWHVTHRFMGLFLGAAVLHSLVVHPIMSALPVLRAWVYGCAAIGLAAYLFRETVEGTLKRRHRYQVSEVKDVGSAVTEVSLEPTKAPIEYRSGQFGFVRFDSGPSHESHPFTISRSPDEGRLRFSIKASGDYTDELLYHLAEGSTARVEGPYGGFGQQLGGRRQLWLAGGIGITPFLAFLGDLGVDREVRLVWSVPVPAEATYAEEIKRAASRLGNVHFQVHVSSTEGHLELANLDMGDTDDLWVYICGPVRMRNAFLKQLRALGVPTSRIFYEEFSLR
jgi:predicted ferric reductase